MNQIVIAIKKENVLTYLTLFDNRTESFTAFNEMRLRDKGLWDPGWRRSVEDRYHSEKDIHAVPSVTIKATHVNNQNP